jgi:5-methyltetrahydropteroyltriglutamate--homocysteine methyltransferase
MKRSSDRILTTHAGSLPRPADILEKLAAKAQAAFDEPAMAERLRVAVADIVRKQVELGVDVVDDGEQGKVGFIPYINERLAGFELDTTRPAQSPWANSREAKSFPEFYAPTHAAQAPNRMVCTGAVSYKGQKPLQRDIDNLKAALKGVKVEEAFMPSVSPTSVADWHRNVHYKNYEEYLFAVAGAMHEEYQAITDAGFLVQIDDPHLVTQWITEPYETIAECRKAAQLQVEALNQALKGIPPEKVRHHTCYGINIGPRVHDLELKHLVDIILTINAQAHSIEAPIRAMSTSGRCGRRPSCRTERS